jgi:hypothetical protein
MHSLEVAGTLLRILDRGCAASAAPGQDLAATRQGEEEKFIDNIALT